MGLLAAVLDTQPSSYWPLTDDDNGLCHDEMQLNDAVASSTAVKLAAIPFGNAGVPYFDGTTGCTLTVADAQQYSQAFANALSVAAWICPFALDNVRTTGTTDQFVHFLGKAVDSSTDVEWALRLYNQTNPHRHSRCSFYTFNLTAAPGQINQGNGAYMEPGVSANDAVPIEVGKWIFLVGQAEPWISDTDKTTGCLLFKQGVEAARSPGDKYESFHVHPQHGPAPISIGGNSSSGFKGAIAHVAIWNRLLSSTEIDALWTAGQSELQSTPMYHSYD